MTQEDKTTLEEFSKAFHKKYGDMFPISLENYLENIKDFVGSAWTYHSLTVTSDISKRKLKVEETNPLNLKLFLASGINPNGITGPNDVGRTYRIKLEVTGPTRITQRITVESRYVHVCEYGKSIEDFFRKVEDKMSMLKKLIAKDNLKFEYVETRTSN